MIWPLTVIGGLAGLALANVQMLDVWVALLIVIWLLQAGHNCMRACSRSQLNAWMRNKRYLCCWGMWRKAQVGFPLSTLKWRA